MAEVQDLDDSGEIGELEAVEQQLTQKAEPETPPAPEMPEKYRGKSIEDIVRMHQEAEKLIGRQAQEVGEVRKLADELLRSQLAPKPKQQEEAQTEVDFFANPQEAVRRAVETHPEVQNAKQLAIQVQQAQAKQLLAAKHPDMGNLVQDPEFQNWVRGSKVRMQLFQAADAYNVDAADELFSTFKALKGAKTPVQQKQEVKVDTEARDQMLKTAAVDTGGSGESGRKVYRRADLIRLRINNPAKYEAMQDEISAAYREGRVK